MRKFILAALLVALTSGIAEARCGKLFKGRVRKAAIATVAAPVKVAKEVLPCANGKCPTPQAAKK